MPRSLATVERRRFLRFGIAAALAPAHAITKAGARSQRASGAEVVRISLDTGPNHLRNVSLHRFAERVDAALPGRFQFIFFESGQLVGDRDATKALLWNELELAAPTILQLARLDPLANITSLPMFYGLPEFQLQQIQDDIVLPALVGRLESRLPVKVLGRGLDLGYTHVFTTKRQLSSSGDLKGLKIRVPGGVPNLRRLRFQGAYPVSIPWSDAPLSLTQGNIDGVTSTYETAQSAALWDVGVRYALEERAMFVQYVPMVRRSFWDRLDHGEQETISGCWRQEQAGARVFAAARQAKARAAALQHGVEIFVPSANELAAERHRLMPMQSALAKELGMPTDTLEQVATAIFAKTSSTAREPAP